MTEMNFEWADYRPGDAVMIDAWLDSQAVSMTGLDQGWDTYWQAVLADAVNFPGCRDYCKIIKENDLPIAVISFGCYRSTATISEIVIAPNYRSKGYGAKIILELLAHADALMGVHNNRFEAVIFPNNLRSKKLFTKAGFTLDQADPDAEFWSYSLPEYTKEYPK